MNMSSSKEDPPVPDPFRQMRPKSAQPDTQARSATGSGRAQPGNEVNGRAGNQAQPRHTPSRRRSPEGRLEPRIDGHAGRQARGQSGRARQTGRGGAEMGGHPAETHAKGLKAIWQVIARPDANGRLRGYDLHDSGLRLIALLATVFLTGVILGLMTGSGDDQKPLTFSSAVSVPEGGPSSTGWNGLSPIQTAHAAGQKEYTQLAMGRVPDEPGEQRAPFGRHGNVPDHITAPDSADILYGEHEAVAPHLPEQSGDSRSMAGFGRFANVYADPASPWRRFAVSAGPDDGRPMVAVVIDDLGMSESALHKLQKMKAPLTLAFLPYARGLAQQTAESRRAGHELIVHMPMQPMGKGDPGPDALLLSDSEQNLRTKLQRSLSRFSGFVGINNHMGSALTSSPAHMEIVMEELGKRGLLFLDSRTHAGTVAAKAAEELGIPHATRHVFLDNHASHQAVLGQLRQTEEIARNSGYAIAIGHPHPGTISALSGWLTSLESKGLRLVPLSRLVAMRYNPQG